MFNQFITTKTTLLDKTQGIYPHFSAIASQQFLRLHPSHQPRFFAARAFPTQVNLDRIAKEWLAKQQFSSTLRSKPFANTLIVGMQHILGTTVDMFSAMRNMGLKHAVIGGKSYSTHNKSARKISGIGFKYIKNTEQLRYGQFNEINTAINCKIWDEALKQIYNRQFNQLIILDDGANLLLNVPAELFNGIKNKPSSIIGIEQTRNGLNNVCFQGLPFPVVNVAGSWVKNIVEYPWVVRAIIGKLNHIFNTQIASNYSRLSTKYVFGVVGYGAMGQTITKELISRNFKVIVFDDDIVRRSSIPRENRYPNMQALISNSDIIIGCTGTDITSSPQSLASIVYSRDKKWLISASSKDTEFNSLLIEIQNPHLLFLIQLQCCYTFESMFYFHLYLLLNSY